MGAWGLEPYDDDKAHDFLLDFFEPIDADAVIWSTFREFEREREPVFPAFRAACYLLQQLGRPFVWPGDDLDALLQEGIRLLRLLQADRDIVELWGDQSGFMDSVQRQIDSLEELLRR